MKYDCLIIGAGPAGVTAALYLRRAGLNVLVLFKDEGALKRATIKNYYSYLGGNGETLFNQGLLQLKENDISCIKEEVLSLKDFGTSFSVQTKDHIYSTEYLLLAMGRDNSKLDSRFQKYLGRGVSLCAICDGPLFRNKAIYVTGQEPYLANIQKELSNYSTKINVINEDDIISLNGKDELEGISLSDGTNLKINNLFVALPLSSTEISLNLGIILLENGRIKTDDKRKTNINKVFATGDICEGLTQVNKAVFDGMIAALQIIEEIKDGRSANNEKKN